MSKLVTILLIFVFYQSTLICQTTDSLDKNHSRDPEFYDAIDFQVMGELNITAGMTKTIRLQANDYLAKNVEFGIRGGLLTIKMKKGMGYLLHKKKMKDEILMIITLPELTYLKNSGLGTVNLYKIKTRHFECEQSGPGNIQLNFSGESCDIKLKGGGKMNLFGLSETLNLNINGSGIVDASELSVQKADVKIKHSGELRINCKNTISIDSDKAGRVFIIGKPEIHEAGSGSFISRLK